MKQSWYVIVGGFLLGLGTLVVFLNFNTPSPTSSLQKAVQQVDQKQLLESAWFEIQNTNIPNRYAVVVKNPKKLPIQSVQAIIQYPSHLVSIENLSIPSSALLELVFPGDSFGINPTEGVVTIVAGYAGKAETSELSFPIAEFDMKKISDTSPAFLSFAQNVKGISSQIIIIHNNEMKNILGTSMLKKISL